MKILKLFLVAFFLSPILIAKENILETYATLNQAVGNIAYTKNGQLVFSHHPFFKPKIRVAKYNNQTKKINPFPNIEWNTPKTENDHYLDDVLGIRNDSKGTIWMLDMGTRNNITPKLVGWNTHTNSLEKIYYIPSPASISTSQLNDFVIDPTHQVVVIADEDIARGGNGSKGALVTINMKTGKTRRLLQGSTSTIPDKKSPIVINEEVLNVKKNGKKVPIFVAADGITLDKNDKWLYYAPLNGRKIYRIEMANLINESLTEEQLNKKVEVYSEKINNGGFSIDKDNNLYATNIENASIGIVKANQKKYTILSSHDKMFWPDGLSYNKDGYMYVSAAQVHLGKPFNNGVDKTSLPFYIFRFKPLAKGIFGR